MDKKVAVGMGAVAATYVTSRSIQRSPDKASPQVAAGDGAHVVEPTVDSTTYSTVTVYYATDRAVETTGSVHAASTPWLVVPAVALGFALFVVWFSQHGRRKLAWTAGLLGCLVVVLVGVLLVSRANTNRRSAGLADSGPSYGATRGDLQVGTCDVSIPATHRVGQLEKPSLLRLELQARPDRHVLLLEVVPEERSAFHQAVRQRVRKSPSRDLFVFVHGYNVSFDLAARRTAQIAYDLKFAGAPIFYSWPSQGKPWKYTVDEANVAWSVPHLKQFLTELSEQSGAQSIHLIAHSMGSRALAEAVRELAAELKTDTALFQQVILAAPDIDADVFREQIAPALCRQSAQVTLYASAHDEALAASKVVHGTPRAGDSESQPIVLPGIDTIDVSAVDMSALGHSYYGSSQTILRDLSTLLRQGRPAADRPWLKAVPVGNLRYWLVTEPNS